MDEYNFDNFKAAMALLNEAISQSDNHEQVALYLSKKQDNQFFDFSFINYILGIENQLTEALATVMSAFDPPIDEVENG